jgi:hypothetical protein
VAQLAQDPVADAGGDPAVLLPPGGVEGAGVETGELGVVVEHFLEVGQEPLRIGGVTVEAAADVVVDAAEGHRVEGGVDHGRKRGAVFGGAQQQREGGVGRELGRAVEAAVARVEAALQ